MEELITYKDLDKTDGFIVRSRPDHTGITIHTPHCTQLSIDFITNIRSNKEISKREHRFYHVETLNEALRRFDWRKQPNPHCRVCRP